MSQANMSFSNNVITISALLFFYCFENGNIFIECTNQGHVIILSGNVGAFSDGGYDNSNSQSSKGYTSAKQSDRMVSHGVQSQGFVSNPKSRRGLNGVLTVLHANGLNEGKSGYEYQNKNSGQNVYQYQDVNSFDGLGNTQGRKARENPPVSSHVAVPVPDSPGSHGGFSSLGKGSQNQGVSYGSPQKLQVAPASVDKGGSSGGWQPENSFDGRVFYNGHQGVVSFPMGSNKGGGDVQLNSKGGFGSPGAESHKGRGGSIDYAKGGGNNQNAFNVGKGNFENPGINHFNVQGPGKSASSGKGESVPRNNKKGGTIDQVPQPKQSRTPKRRVVVIPVLKHVAVVEHVPVIEHIKVIADDDTFQGLNGKTLSLGRSSIYGDQLGVNYNDGDDITQGISGVDFQNFKGLSGNTALDGGGKDFVDTGSLNTGKSIPTPNIPNTKNSHPGTTPRTKDHGGGSIQNDGFGDFGKGSYQPNEPSAGVHNVNEYRSGGKTFIIFHATELGKGQFAQGDSGGGGKGGQKGFDGGSHGGGYNYVNNEPGNFYGSGKSDQHGGGTNFQHGSHSFPPSGKNSGGFDSGGYAGGNNAKGVQNVQGGIQSGKGFSGFNPGHQVGAGSTGGQKGTSSGFKGLDQGYANAGWGGDTDSKNGGVSKGTGAGTGVDFSGVVNTFSGKGGPANGKGTDFNNIGHQNKGGGISQNMGKNVQQSQNVFPAPEQSFSFKGTSAGGGGIDAKGTNLGPGAGKNFPEQQLPKGNIVEGIDLRLIESLLAASGSSGKNNFNDGGGHQQLQTGKNGYNGGNDGGHKGNAKDYRSNKRSTDDFMENNADGSDPGKFGGEMWW